MQELVGRLTALDPVASETLKVVAYFDALVASGVGLDGLLRAAAAMSGTVAGAQRRGRVSRFSAGGRRLDAEVTARHPERVQPGFDIWLERDGELHANDEMVVERLALAVELLDARRGSGNGLDTVVDESTPIGERAAVLARLRVDAGARIRLIATAIGDAIPGATSTIVSTRYGMLRATLDTTGVAPDVVAGLGRWVRADHAPTSWNGAIVAYRLADTADPVIDATSLGAILQLAQVYDPDVPHDDVTAIGRLSALEFEVLRALVESDSIRAAAARLGMHHSSVQARHEALTRELGYDPRSPIGRMRCGAATILWRLTTPDAQ
ncbi:hypothetical protein HH308_19980 [Gordonia sp. TBRC 11910]|uniref:PucR C-terminal helix-turn-helix domain-containing protein n=2 Tax=Gordonia asplenii TaxID=2725283 RepID=A0A848L7E4_9ACTN|nr:hypothetical protein [Gordonia asplenii]